MNTKNFLYVMAATSAAALSACVSVSKVTPTAGGAYIIQGRAVGVWNADKERAKALKKANDYCGKQGKRMICTILTRLAMRRYSGRERR